MLAVLILMTPPTIIPPKQPGRDESWNHQFDTKTLWRRPWLSQRRLHLQMVRGASAAKFEHDSCCGCVSLQPCRVWTSPFWMYPNCLLSTLPRLCASAKSTWLLHYRHFFFQVVVIIGIIGHHQLFCLKVLCRHIYIRHWRPSQRQHHAAWANSQPSIASWAVDFLDRKSVV